MYNYIFVYYSCSAIYDGDCTLILIKGVSNYCRKVLQKILTFNTYLPNICTLQQNSIKQHESNNSYYRNYFSAQNTLNIIATN